MKTQIKVNDKLTLNLKNLRLIFAHEQKIKIEFLQQHITVDIQ